MHKRDYTEPMKTRLRKRAVLPIYLDYKEQEEFRGNAKLIEKYENDWYKKRHPVDQRAYIRAEIGGGNVYDSHTIIYSWECWKVKFLDGPSKGWTTAVRIAYFVTISFDYTSGYEIDSLL
jgi:hypothetical protein